LARTGNDRPVHLGSGGRPGAAEIRCGGHAVRQMKVSQRFGTVAQGPAPRTAFTASPPDGRFGDRNIKNFGSRLTKPPVVPAQGARWAPERREAQVLGRL